ncbi:adenosylcobalamin-dependent ribonucleoside-diphosphate reductase [Fusobacterium sp.]|uniref:adenosylcobalamin-dependent ribonucleoside-diphosphate reductase n=1 Tax=Fusobacterium sp. TaxID=68766 RepID=UPI0028FF2527|nr:adenosylcobalamin-dependent ribonucleoside-diphosphate reductase [Fusobacterium sp.]MDU1911683.1 adenosylcobalamin-dependent ribonucleoside-diphosphate reductase [Fusobacterium sp.]
MDITSWLGKDNKLGMDIWEKKYKYDGETFNEWLERVSGGEQELKEMIANKEFIFAGRILSNRGLYKLGRKITYSNCYVIAPPEDNLESIFDTAKKLARTYSYGGGCGVDISKLRPKGSEVNNSAKYTTGSISFMELYNLTTDIIGQKGRRGALMISIDINHPDVSEFISIKSDLNKIQKANISVRVDANFMKAVIEGLQFVTEFLVKDTGEVITKEIDARKLFKELARQNWKFAEPGILFWDRISKWNLLSEDEEFEYAGTNPCAEEPLPAGGSCLLGSLILPTFVEGKEFNFDRLAYAVQKSVKALNDVLDEGLPLHPLEEQRESVRDWRQIGLGILGVGDLLIKLGLKYGAPESLEFCDNIAKVIVDNALKASALLAKDFGAYPKYKADKVLKSEFLLENASVETLELIEKYGLRNSQLLTIAPTGSIGTMLETSTGIEPNFAFSYVRKTESLHGEDVFYKVFIPIAKKYMEENNLMDEEELPEHFVTAQNLNPYDRIKMQGIWQKRIDASISSTINLVNKVSVEEVEKLYLEAWKNGLKGMTIYRAGCDREGILTVAPKEKKAEELVLPTIPRGELKPIAPDTIYYPTTMRIGCGKLKVMIGYSPSERAIQDLYVIRSGVGGCEKNIQAVAIYMSGILRLGGNLFMLEKAIAGVSGCTSFAVARSKNQEISKGNTCPSAILNILKNFEKDMGLDAHEKAIQKIDEEERKEIEEISEREADYVSRCPECGEIIDVTGGCYTCRSCGFSKCE